MNSKSLTIAVTSALLCAPVFLGSCEKTDTAAQPRQLTPEVQVSKPETKDVSITQEWVGNLRGSEDAEIRSQVKGYLLSKNYKDGSFVKKGQVLFQIDPRPFQAALQQAKGDLAQHEATLKKYRLDVERYANLIKTGAISQKQLDDAKQQVQATEASIVSAKARVAEAEINLNYTTIKSPIDGLAGLATPSIGDSISPTDAKPLTTISAITPIRVDFSVSEKDFLEVRHNKKNDKRTSTFKLILANDELYAYEGEATAADRNVDVQTGTVGIVGYVPNPDLDLRPGMFVRVKAVVKTLRNATLVPPRAIYASQSANFIVYLNEQNIPSMTPVTLGPIVDGMQVVNFISVPNSPYTKDSPIVVEGLHQALRCMQLKAPVKPVPYQATVSQPVSPSISTDSFDKAKQPEGMQKTAR